MVEQRRQNLGYWTKKGHLEDKIGFFCFFLDGWAANLVQMELVKRMGCWFSLVPPPSSPWKQEELQL